MNINKQFENILKETSTLYEDIYEANFSDYFSKVRDLYSSLKSNIRPISDAELEYILTTLPLDLFTVSENLNSLRLQVEVIKLKNREIKFELTRDVTLEANKLEDISLSEKKDAVNRSVSYGMTEYERTLAIYESVVSRVENELSFSRELIMGAKKIWDSRRSAEKSNPVGEVTPDLPDYKLEKQQYIK